MLQCKVNSTTSTFLRLFKKVDLHCAFFHKNFRKGTSENYYDVLGVSQTASDKEIREAFIELCKQVHPDADSKDKTLHDKFVKINKAYSVLSKPIERKLYDDGLKAGLHMEADEVSTTQNWNPKHAQYYYHPRFYNDPRMRKEAAKAWEKNTGYSFAEYKREDFENRDGILSKSAAIYVCIFLMMLGSLLAYLQYRYAKNFVQEKRRQSVEIEERSKIPEGARVVTLKQRPRNRQKKDKEEEKDLSEDSLAGPISILPTEQLKT